MIASSGAGKVEHFSEVFKKTDIEAALAAGIFHREEVPIEAVKEHMRARGIETRRIVTNTESESISAHMERPLSADFGGAFVFVRFVTKMTLLSDFIPKFRVRNFPKFTSFKLPSPVQWHSLLHAPCDPHPLFKYSKTGTIVARCLFHALFCHFLICPLAVHFPR